MTRWWILLVAAALGVGVWIGRQTVDELRELIFPRSPHDAYSRALAESPLADAALVRIWRRAAEVALAEAPRVDAPFREDGYLDPGRPVAVAYRFRARVGERVRIGVTLQPATDALVFVDLFRADSGSAPVPVASADSGETALEYEPGRTGDYIVRVQPELLRGGRYALEGAVLPTMAFPVEGRGRDAVQSFFGDPRDGGRRDHHGIDIFAPRGTPVVATVAGRVSRVRTTSIGGRVVWLRDERRAQSICYAHPEEQLVRDGDRVEPGDTLGLVGNSGNARSTPPHLHFGIYRRGAGPQDPFPFVAPRPASAPPPARVEGLGRWRRVASEARVRSSPSTAAPVVADVAAGVPVRTDAVTGEWLRVELPDGRRGFLAARLTESPDPIRTERVAAAGSLRDRPVGASVEVSRLREGEEVEVLGRFEDHLYVRAGAREAWLRMAAPD